ncbi:hypothetical protein NIES267_73030 (plasmid) [Calothrix parasitica NIES-267]|uniref:Uncharacterized protein n=1 Tax=Calothrix parasitica NIES-267 TaxID=1973488 RepID=A0A1Z4M2S0_9CYAN|nr:hypothetical protein NIES267_73030 [Calothrix parasitica NIES-267]
MNELRDYDTNESEIKCPLSSSKSLKPYDRWRYFLAAGLLGGLFLHTFIKAGLMNQHLGFISPVIAQTPHQYQEESSISYNSTSEGFIPDWSRIKFENMVFSEGGNITYTNAKGEAKTRTWQAGENLAQIMEFGDFSDSGLGIEEISLEYMAQKLDLNLTEISLADFELIKWQTLPNLVDAIPQLKELQVSQVRPVQDFLNKLGVNEELRTIGAVINKNPWLSDIPLSENINLENYRVTEIPGLTEAQIQNFAKWDDTLINGVPGLNELPWSEFPRILSPTLAFVGKVDLPLKEVEADRTRSISGSYQEGFNVPCLQENCAHMEIAGSGNTTGVQWISGKYQKVEGGFGPLSVVFNGKEPTGRHPFGEAFKQVVWNIYESNGDVETTMFFRVCKRIPLVGKTCTPYGIGPVPFIVYHEKDPIILGSPSTLPE